MSAKMSKCPQCGAKFFVPSPRDWAYRDASTYYCSWKCIREHDAHIPPHKTKPETVPQVMPEETAERVRASVKEEMRRSVRNQPVKPAKAKREYRKNLSAQKISRVLGTMQRLKTEMGELREEIEALKREGDNA